MATRSFQQTAAVGFCGSEEMHGGLETALLGARAGNAQVRIDLDTGLAQRIDVTLVTVAAGRGLVGAANHGDGAVAKADQVIGGQRNAVAVVAAIGRHVDAIHRTGHQNGGHAVFFRQRHILDRRADGRRHDDAIRTQLQQCFDEGALFFHRIIMVERMKVWRLRSSSLSMALRISP